MLGCAHGQSRTEFVSLQPTGSWFRRGIYMCRGLIPSIAAILPEAAITYGLFDLLKRGAARWAGQESPSVPLSLSCGVLAAFTGQVVAYPLETISRRMQVLLLTTLSACPKLR